MARTMRVVPTTENRSDEATRNFELEDIDLFGDVPAFTPLDKPSWAQGETPYVETTIIVRDDA